MNILLGITGSIAAYKAADIANGLTKAGCSVDAILTETGAEFITALTIQTLTKRKVYTDMFADYTPSEVEHISLAKRADRVLIAPASADIIAKAALGIADDMLSTVLLAAWEKPLYIAPAMNTAMYENPATRRNLEILRERGAKIIEPREALLACGDVGRGALAPVEEIIEEVLR